MSLVAPKCHQAYHPGSQRNQQIGFNIYLLKSDFINNMYINLYLYLKFYGQDMYEIFHNLFNRFTPTANFRYFAKKISDICPCRCKEIDSNF